MDDVLMRTYQHNFQASGELACHKSGVCMICKGCDNLRVSWYSLMSIKHSFTSLFPSQHRNNERL